MLAIHGDNDIIAPSRTSQVVTELVNGEVEIIEGAGHNPAARFPARVNTLIRDFLHRHLGSWKPTPAKRTSGPKKALYLSSPIGLGHARRDLAISRELQAMHPGLQIDWLAQDPVTRVLSANGERVHPASHLLASETSHLESESSEHDLHCFQAWRKMDEILVSNFMVFHDVARAEPYDLWIGDEKVFDASGLGGYKGESCLAAQQHFVDCLGRDQPFETSGEDYLQGTFAAVERQYVHSGTPQVGKVRARQSETADLVVQEIYPDSTPPRGVESRF